MATWLVTILRCCEMAELMLRSSIRDYLYTHNVQLGATYKAGTQSTEAYGTAMKACAEFINAAPDEVGTPSLSLL